MGNRCRVWEKEDGTKNRSFKTCLPHRLRVYRNTVSNGIQLGWRYLVLHVCHAGRFFVHRRPKQLRFLDDAHQHLALWTHTQRFDHVQRAVIVLVRCYQAILVSGHCIHSLFPVPTKPTFVNTNYVHNPLSYYSPNWRSSLI